jgi:lipid-A-disaccharide synthase
MSRRRPTIFLSAAEASGDLHASNLIRALRRRCPEARLVGVAGPRMQQAGCEALADVSAEASMLLGATGRLDYWLGTLRRMRSAIRRLRPDLHVPVDSPALNWHLAAAARAAGTPVAYYIAPQVWAWAPWRVRKLARLTDQVACILPFEEAYLRARGVRATYVGHPLFDTLGPQRGPAELPDLLDAWADGTWRVALLPGSRPGEIDQHVPALAAAAVAVRRRWPRARCLLSARQPADARRARPLCAGAPVEIVTGETHGLLASAHVALAVSGTVTLEAAHFGLPVVVFYRVGRGLRAARRTVGRWILRTPHLSLVNILAGRQLVPEIMPWNGNPRIVTNALLELMDDPGSLLEMRQELQDLVRPLRVADGTSASDNAARVVCQALRRPGRD